MILFGLPQLDSSICCHFWIRSGQRFLHNSGLEKCRRAVQHTKMSGISLRIFLEGSRGSIPPQEIHFSLQICFNMFSLEVRYENRPERGSRGSSRRAATAVLHEKSLRIQWNCSQTKKEQKYIYKNSRSSALGG